MGVGIAQGAPGMVRRTLGSLVPHPASIGKVSGIGTPRLHLAFGGRGGNAPPIEDIGANIFSPINPEVGVPNMNQNFITSPQLQPGPGAPKGIAAQPQKEDPMAQFNQTAAGVNNMINTGVGAAKAYDWLTAPSSIIPEALNPATGWQNASLLSQINADPTAGSLLNTISANGAGAEAAGEGAAASAAWYQPLADAATAAWEAVPTMAELAAFFAADGGAVPGRAEGGDIPGLAGLTGMLRRQESYETFHPKGFLNSAGPGRTDTINTNVPAGSYVIPADVVSGLGEGNSLAGSAVIDKMFGSNPYGIKTPHIGRGRGAPAGHVAPGLATEPQQGVDTAFIDSAGKYAKGGAKEEKAPVVVAGGEYVVSDKQLIRKFGSLKKAHKIMDHWVIMMRDKHIKELKKLDAPVGSRISKK